MNQSTAIAIRDDQTTFDDLQKRALAHIGVETANPADLAVFFHTCKRTGLDPFARQIYMIKRDGKQTMQTGIDGLRLVAQRTAERTGETFGYEDTLWCGEDGRWVDVWLSPEPPRAAKATVVRNGQKFPAVALFDEYVQRKRDGVITQMWKTKGALMLAKCAEAAALRKAFPQDLSGLYTADELTQQPTPVASVQPRAAAADFLQPSAADAPPAVDDDVRDAELVDDDAPAETGEAPSEEARRKMFALFNDLGMADGRTGEGRQERLAYVERVLGHAVTSSKELTAAQTSSVIESLLADLEARDQAGAEQ